MSDPTDFHEHDAAGCLDCSCASAPMNSAPCTCPAAPETETDANGLTEAERKIVADGYRGPWDRIVPERLFQAVERIVAERVRVVEGERDAARAQVHGVAWEDRLNIVCLCGRVCNADMGKSPAPLMGSTSDYYVRKPAAQVFAQHLIDSRINPRAESAEAAHEAEKAAHERLRAGVEALASPQWRRNRGHEFNTTSEAYAAGRNALVDDLRALLAGGEAR